VALLLFGATAALARWRAGMLADRVGTRLLLPASVLAIGLGTAGLALGLLLGSDVVLLTAAAASGIGYGAVQNLTLVQAFARVEPRDTPTASAVWNLCFDGGTAIGAVAVGALAAWSGRTCGAVDGLGRGGLGDRLGTAGVRRPGAGRHAGRRPRRPPCPRLTAWRVAGG
jgi:predicted MFS family arabinose efflux permease